MVEITPEDMGLYYDAVIAATSLEDFLQLRRAYATKYVMCEESTSNQFAMMLWETLPENQSKVDRATKNVVKLGFTTEIAEQENAKLETEYQTWKAKQETNDDTRRTP